MCEHCPYRVAQSPSSEYRGLTVLEYTLCLLNNNYNIVPQAVSSDDTNKLYAFNYSLKLIYMIAMSQRLNRLPRTTLVLFVTHSSWHVHIIRKRLSSSYTF